MLTLKFLRVGKKGQPSYRIIAIEKRTKINGKNVEDLGWYDPKNKGFKLNEERVKYWISQGAQPTDSVHNLLVRAGIRKATKIAKHSVPKKEAVKAEAAPAVAA
jgi:small subunit ribosomal protein S16